MTALSKNTPRKEAASGGREFVDPVAAAAVIYNGSVICLDASGDAIPLDVTVANVRGVAMEEADNTAGAAGDIAVRVRRGAFLMTNLGTVTRAHIGDTIYFDDDNTVRPDAPVGGVATCKCLDVLAEGVLVEIL